MTPKEEMINKISIYIDSLGTNKNIDEVRMNLYALIGEYNVEAIGTDIVLYDQNSNEAILQKYFINMKIRNISLILTG